MSTSRTLSLEIVAASVLLNYTQMMIFVSRSAKIIDTSVATVSWVCAFFIARRLSRGVNSFHDMPLGMILSSLFMAARICRPETNAMKCKMHGNIQWKGNYDVHSI